MGSFSSPLMTIVFITLLCHLEVHAIPAVFGNDVDSGELREDILEINLESERALFEGDIAGDPKRNALLDETSRWKFPIPYILTDSLDLNAKGVILQAFETYRLKSCVDFKPYNGEETYLSFTKLDGCWSFVGDLHEGQNVSIGDRCDTRAIVEHELLHALGFYHEQSRSDRDDYVKIWWDQIIPGKEHNFNKYADDVITDLNTPYDYESIMHYRPLSFNKNATVPTITTTIQAFSDIIGQRLDFSAIDLVKLNRMYNCTDTYTLLDQCSFELINICGMIQNEQDDADWVQTLSSPGTEDQTLVGQCKDAGYFMYFDTSEAEVGKSAMLESRILYPKRNQQCLQFFYKMTGTTADNLVIWMKTDDGTGNVRKMKKVYTIQGGSSETWKIAHVTLNGKDKFRYIFQGIVGSNKMDGGIYIDDISLTETPCPSTTWQLSNFTHILQTSPTGHNITSERFYSAEGYAYGVRVYPNGKDSSTQGYLGVYFHLCSGENDGVLEWPAQNRQVTVTAMDQDPDVKLRMSSSRSFTSDNTWVKPITNGEWDDSCECFRSQEFGWSTFISHQQLLRRNFLKNNNLILSIDFNDLTKLIRSEVQVSLKSTETVKEIQEGPGISDRSFAETPKLRVARSASGSPCQPNPCRNGGACVDRHGKAVCRCASGKAIFYTGMSCETQRISGGMAGVLIGGVAGALVFAVIITVITRRQAHKPGL
ncbi:meprin A subunit alpha isoform X2 [Paramormyrops kingsleyae]|uniref:meprin A subunit alpha isoform X2 n=1 Tax=Paramormyrops kingsleyae TaxID=1676925 RepID=UPI000CD5F5E4|nr:meprin A subunit alpha-like isoform X1 [Paramormyrops kingsleyae]